MVGCLGICNISAKQWSYKEKKQPTEESLKKYKSIKWSHKSLGREEGASREGKWKFS